MEPLNIVTIVAKNYLAQARVLADSFKKIHPNGNMYVFFVDRIDGFFDPKKEDFTTIEVEELREEIENLDGFCFQYSILELCTAFKPFVLHYLFKKYNLSKLAYFDPDILITASLQPIADLLDNYNIVLTPHITQPYSDNKQPTELEILRSGVYNLGFIALANTEVSTIMLKWWQQKLYSHCIDDKENGIFVDQKWVEFVPSFFTGTYILRDPAYNVAYWNLNERVVKIENNIITSNGELLRFFHFSGYSPDFPRVVSKHQNRGFGQIADSEKLFLRYAELLQEFGYQEIRRWPYSYATYSDGTPITENSRKIYRECPNKLNYKNPFQLLAQNSFFQLLDNDNCLLTSNLEKYSGVNLSGYIHSEKGMGAAGRSNIRCLQETSYSFLLNNVNDPSAKNLEIQDAMVSKANPYKINLIHVNADQLIYFIKEKGQEYFHDRYTIGRWEWELSEFPPEWNYAFDFVDEVWVASSFIQEAISKVCKIPVIRVPHAIKIIGNNKQPAHDRDFFNLPHNKFIFLFMFDFDSYVMRKNPQGTIAAFKKVFSVTDNAALVIKCSHSETYPDEMAQLREMIEGTNIIILDKIFSDSQVTDLMLHADCYVSLHRAEGYGLTIAEAMGLGKPVITTAYSGNTDFITPDNCYPVKFKLVTIDKDYNQYKKGSVWAEPDIDHAAELMRYVFENPDQANETGKNAREFILNNYSSKAIGKIYQERLDFIVKNLQASTTTPPPSHPINEMNALNNLIDLRNIPAFSDKPSILSPFIKHYKRLVRKSSFWLLHPLFSRIRDLNAILFKIQIESIEKQEALWNELKQQQKEILLLKKLIKKNDREKSMI